MTTELYDYEFFPWHIDGDRRIVASEDEWTSMRAFASESGAARIRVPVDVFEDWKGSMVDAAGRHLWVNENDELEVQLMPGRSDILFYEQKYKPLRMADVRRLTFALINEYPSATWLLETEHPENVAAMKPPTPVYESATTGEMLPYWGPNKVERPNLWLYARCDTQAEADARIPHLLRCPAVVRGLVMEPREDVNLALVLGGAEESRSVQNGWHGIDHVIIRGGTEPLHPDNVRSIVRQCEAAGVPVWCESPVDGRAVKQLPEGLK